MRPETSVSSNFGIIIPCEATYTLGIGPHVSLKVATMRFLEYLSKAKTE